MFVPTSAGPAVDLEQRPRSSEPLTVEVTARLDGAAGPDEGATAHDGAATAPDVGATAPYVGATAHDARATANELGATVPNAGRAEPSAGYSPHSYGVPDAGSVHALLKELTALGNEVRLRFLEALRLLDDDRLWYELGYSSFRLYCDRELGLARSTALDYLRAITALDDLPRLRAMFSQGELSWYQVREISRVAIADTELAWIEMAIAEPVRELIAEVREAGRTGRTAPRDRRNGLPNLLVRLSIELTLEEKERVRAAFARVGEALEEGAGGSGRDGPDGRPVLVRWADGILSGVIPATQQPTPSQRPTPSQTVVYHACPECRRATVETEDGRVSVPFDRVKAVATHANVVTISPREEVAARALPPGEIDAPSSARLARQVLHRDGLRCANPGCGSQRNLHAHHLVFRSDGGRTAMSNEITVCDVCHAMLHSGLLGVSGALDTGLRWQPRPRDDRARVGDAAAVRSRVQALAATVPARVRKGRTLAETDLFGLSARADGAYGASTSTNVPSPVTGTVAQPASEGIGVRAQHAPSRTSSTGKRVT